LKPKKSGRHTQKRKTHLMPTEHEYKFLLSLELAKDFDHARLLKMAKEHQHIMQGYLAFSKGMTTRIRCIDDGDKQKWFLTFKQKVDERVIEIEKRLDDRDGKDLWSICVGKLKKDRYVIEDKGIKWEVDFFKKGHHLYFVMAEVELPEGASRPKLVPDFLKEYILYEVPLTDDRFSNKRLSEVEFATNLYHQILNGETNGDEENL